MAIHWRLREVLDAAEVTPWELAQRLGVRHPSIYRLAKQRQITRITTAHLDALCAAIGCEPGDLLAYEPDPPKRKRKR